MYRKNINRIDRDFPLGKNTVEGVVDSFPVQTRSRFGYTKIRFCLKCLKREKPGGEWQNISQKIIVTVSNSTMSFQYGDQLLLKGEILRTTSSRNPGAFDFDAYLEHSGISARFVVKGEDDLKLISSANGNRFVLKIYKVKEKLLKLIDQKIPYPENAVLKGMLLGNREEIPSDLSDDYSKSGTAHILAISGGNIWLMAFIFVAIFRIFRLSKRFSYFITIFLLIVYCILTGGDPSITRATIMAGIYLLGIILGRETELITSLAWSAFLILIFAPLQIFSAGFQLSFLTVIALGVLVPSLPVLSPVPAPDHPEFSGSGDLVRIKIRNFFSFLFQFSKVSIAVWIGILPVMASYFYLFSPVTILANLFVVPYFSLVLSCGFAFLLLGSVHHFMADLLGRALWFFTKILDLMCSGFASIPFGYFRVSPPTFFDYFLFYTLLILWIFRQKLHLDKKRFVFIFLVFLNLYVWKDNFRLERKNLKITFLDVGHGDAALIQFPKRGNLLVDTGEGGDWDQGRMTVAPFLWHEGITHLDGIMVTHPHSDHCGGLKYLLKEFSVGKVFDNGDHEPSYEKIFKDSKVQRMTLQEGNVIQSNHGVDLTVLNPPKEFMINSSMNPNNQSLVTQLCFKDIRVLFCADADEKALESLIGYGEELKSVILKTPHHGSFRKKFGPQFFSLVGSEVAIITEAEKNKFKLPSNKAIRYLELLRSKVYQTGFTGSIEFETDGSTYTVKTMLKI